MLLEKNKEQATKGVITATSILSPQAVITSAVAKHIGVDCTIMYGGTTAKKILLMPYPTACLNMGAKIKIVAKILIKVIFCQNETHICEYRTSFS
mgnify:CR=1 FL=1